MNVDRVLPSWIVKRGAWKANPPLRPRIPTVLPWARNWLHHTAAPPVGPGAFEMLQVQRYHQSINWRDFAYNFGIDRDGVVYEGMGLFQHLNSDAASSGSVVLLGNHETHDLTNATKESMAKLSAHGLLAGWWKESYTGGHREIPGAQTLCPGKYAMAAIPKINVRTREIIRELSKLEKEEPMAWIIRATDPSGAQRNAITDGVTRRELVNNTAMNEASQILGLAVKTVSWNTWAHQFGDARKLDTIAALPKAATAAEVVAATQTAVNDILAALDGITVDGVVAGGSDARQLLLDLLNAE